jgi:hypothetical protein
MFMNTPIKTNNQRLRELVENAGLTQSAALAIFNLELGPRGLSENSWRAFFCAQGTSRFREFKDSFLTHAEKVLAPLSQKP